MKTKTTVSITLMVAAPLIAVSPILAAAGLLAICAILKPPYWQGAADSFILAGVAMLASVPMGIASFVVGLVGLLVKSKPDPRSK